jgi:hypothetical protein
MMKQLITRYKNYGLPFTELCRHNARVARELRYLEAANLWDSLPTLIPNDKDDPLPLFPSQSQSQSSSPSPASSPSQAQAQTHLQLHSQSQFHIQLQPQVQPVGSPHSHSHSPPVSPLPGGDNRKEKEKEKEMEKVPHHKDLLMERHMSQHKDLEPAVPSSPRLRAVKRQRETYRLEGGELAIEVYKEQAVAQGPKTDKQQIVTVCHGLPTNQKKPTKRQSSAETWSPRLLATLRTPHNGPTQPDKAAQEIDEITRKMLEDQIQYFADKNDLATATIMALLIWNKIRLPQKKIYQLAIEYKGKRLSVMARAVGAIEVRCKEDRVAKKRSNRRAAATQQGKRRSYETVERNRDPAQMPILPQRSRWQLRVVLRQLQKSDQPVLRLVLWESLAL